MISSPENNEQLYESLSKDFLYAFPTDVVDMFEIFPGCVGYKDFLAIGHFYSAYPDINYLKRNSDRIFDETREILDINLNEQYQISILEKMTEYYSSMPEWLEISDDKDSKYRYRHLNDNLPASDAVGLHTMLRIINPKNLIEVGSGWSSAVTLDTNEFYLDGKMNVTFIEPYPQLLESICRNKKSDYTLIASDLQEIPLSQFEILEDGDILFIDSTHTSKVASDVNFLFFEVFPRLKKGVYIHLHDIDYPFEYPMEWLEKGVVWNEAYLLRAFLQNNKDYEIVFFENMMDKKHKDLFLQKWPLKYEISGASFWMRKVK